jgi:hypothetical protein
MKRPIEEERDAALFSAWERFVQTGRVCDYLSYCQQDNSRWTSGREGTETDAGDSKWTGDSGKGAEQ